MTVTRVSSLVSVNGQAPDRPGQFSLALGQVGCELNGMPGLRLTAEVKDAHKDAARKRPHLAILSEY